jgi:superoxide dismutase, Fe-Mn family
MSNEAFLYLCAAIIKINNKMKNLIYTLSIITVAALVSCNNSHDHDHDHSHEHHSHAVKDSAETPMGNPADVKADSGAFPMIALPYAYNALEPYIDARTMEIHFSKHHLAYTNNFNKAIAGTPMEKLTIEEIMKKLDPENKAVRNNGGGYFNHNLFWEIMGPGKGGEPTGELSEAINKDFGSFADFKTKFNDAAMKQFGSGWAWLVVDKSGKLSIVSTANQDNPLMAKLGYSGVPLMGVDVWEHAYYLKYQNKRKDYLDSFFNVINWEKVAEKFLAAKKK